MDGFQYKSTKPSEANSGGIIAIDPNEVAVMKLRIIPTSEGYFDALNNQYIYNYTDHLGNVRLSFSDTNKDGIIQPRQYKSLICIFSPAGNVCYQGWKPGEIVEVNNYYPFGLLHNYAGTAQNAYQYRYNGKELQETGMYDYGARFYMPDIGRWGVVDPLAEMNRAWSPFKYGFNNPVRFIDPDGRNEDIWELNNQTGQLNKVEDNNDVDIVYVVDGKGNRQTNNGEDIKFTMERNNQIDDAYNTTVPVTYNPKSGETATKDVDYKVINFNSASTGKGFFEFLEGNSNALNEFDMFQYTQKGIDKAAVGINGQNGYLPTYRPIDGKPNQYLWGAFIPSVSLMSGYYQNLSNQPGVDQSKNIFSHSHPGDNGNPEPSNNDLNTARRSTLPGIFQVYSKGVYKTIPRQ